MDAIRQFVGQKKVASFSSPLAVIPFSSSVKYGAVCYKEGSFVLGAPDFVLEVILPSTGRKDCIKKLYKYEKAGVREYWLLIDFSGVIQWME